MKISRAIANITVGNRSLRSTAVKMPDDSFAVQVYNFENMAEAETAVKTAVEGSVPNAVSTLRTLPGAPKSAVLRFNPKTEEETKVILSAVEKVIQWLCIIHNRFSQHTRFDALYVIYGNIYCVVI